jgi:hypothetical protein
VFIDRYLILLCGTVLGAMLIATAVASLLPGHTAGQVLRAVEVSALQG